jgi:hypothetical protein
MAKCRRSCGCLLAKAVGKKQHAHQDEERERSILSEGCFSMKSAVGCEEHHDPLAMVIAMMMTGRAA